VNELDTLATVITIFHHWANPVGKEVFTFSLRRHESFVLISYFLALSVCERFANCTDARDHFFRTRTNEKSAIGGFVSLRSQDSQKINSPPTIIVRYKISDIHQLHVLVPLAAAASFSFFRYSY